MAREKTQDGKNQAGGDEAAQRSASAGSGRRVFLGPECWPHSLKSDRLLQEAEAKEEKQLL